MAIEAALAAFPRRPIAVQPPPRTVKPWFLGLFCILLFGGFGFLFATHVVPDLLNDYSIRNQAVPIQGRIENGRCRTRLGFLQDCDVTIVVTGNKSGTPTVRKTSYLFADPHLGDYDVMVMGDPARPELATTDLGLDNLRSRAITAVVAAVLIVLLIVGGFLIPIQAMRARRDVAGLSGQSLTPVAVHVQGTKQGWSVRTAPKAKPRIWAMPKKAQPFWVQPEEGLALAVTTPGGPVYPLDEELSALDLSPDEKYRLQQAAAA